MYIVQFTVGDVPMGEPVAGEQMEREPHEVLHDFFLYFVLYMKFYIYYHSFLKHQILMFVHVHCVQVSHASHDSMRIETLIGKTLHPSLFDGHDF